MPSTAAAPSGEESVLSASLVVFAEMLDTIDREGLNAFQVKTNPSLSEEWATSLEALAAAAPLNAFMADTLLGRIKQAFAAPLQSYQTALLVTQKLTSATVLVALQRLCLVYETTMTFLCAACAKLRVPGLVPLFSVFVRGSLLQADLLTGEQPRAKAALLGFLRRHGRQLLNHPAAAGSSSPSAVDPILHCLHRLTLSQSRELKQLWRSVLEQGIQDQLRHLSNDFSTHYLREQMHWLERSVVPFIAMVLAAEPQAGAPSSRTCVHGGEGVDAGAASGREEAAQAATQEEHLAWCTEMRHLLLRRYAHRRLDRFWDILSDYPDSIPALEDMHDCLRCSPESGLKSGLVRTARQLLASRLHRAGTRTEDILAILIHTIHACCVLFPRSERNVVVFAVIDDTLDHLRRRKDCVSAVVQAVMQPGGAMSSGGAPPPVSGAGGGASAAVGGQTTRWLGDADDDGAAEDEGNSDPHDLFADLQGKTGGGGGGDALLSRANARDQADVLRVLLTSVHRRALVEAYQQVLASQLLKKPMHDFDTTPEEEVLERLKQVFGEAVLDRCAVMIRDAQMSRRLSQQLREQRGRRPSAQSVTRSVTVLSMTTWPALAGSVATAAPLIDTAAAPANSTGAVACPVSYRAHPFLQGEVDQLAEAYKRLKDNQKLCWLPYLGRVELEVVQRDPSKDNAPVKVPHILSLFDASLVLYVKQLTNSSSNGAAVPISALASAVEVTEEELRPHVQRLTPRLLVLSSCGYAVAMQQRVPTTADNVFVEEDAAAAAEAKPAGMPPERVKLMERMVTSLLKTRGPQAISAIHSSLKLLAKFEGSSADLLQLLQSFIARGVVVQNDAKQYVLPPK